VDSMLRSHQCSRIIYFRERYPRDEVREIRVVPARGHRAVAYAEDALRVECKNECRLCFYTTVIGGRILVPFFGPLVANVTLIREARS